MHSSLHEPEGISSSKESQDQGEHDMTSSDEYTLPINKTHVEGDGSSNYKVLDVLYV